MGAKKTHADYLSQLLDREIDALPLEDYKGDGTPILHECLMGHKTFRSPNNVLRKYNCSECANNRRDIDTDLYLEKLKRKTIDYIPIEKYINTDTAIKHKCLKGHEWKVAPKHLLSGRKCPQCSAKTGFYCEKFFENNPEAGRQPGILYCVVLVNKQTQERVCIKLGITKGTSNKDVISRTSHFTGYETRIQKIVKGTLEEVYYLEQYLHELWGHRKYTSPWKFGGYSELFELDDEIIRSIPINSS